MGAMQHQMQVAPFIGHPDVHGRGFDVFGRSRRRLLAVLLSNTCLQYQLKLFCASYTGSYLD